MVRKQEKQMDRYGLVGKHISYSFSKDYFTTKFKDEGINNTSYENFDIQNIAEFPSIITKNIKGLNVTIPYKELVIPFLDKIDRKAKKIGAVNTIKISKKGKLKGFNTDYYGFKKTLEPYIENHHKRALILGTGGASKAIAFALKKMKIKYAYVSRNPSKETTFNYTSLTENDIKNHQIIINCTPLGTFPNTEEYPNIPYLAITKQHILFDLIYNPLETKFLAFGKSKNATTINGLNMLKLQANKAWKIWNS